MSDDNNSQPLPLLPYLCQPSAILGLVLVGELLALVLVLADLSADFSWALLGAVSMVVQWIVLSSALLLCQLRGRLNQLPLMASGSLAFMICLAISALVLWAAQWFRLQPFDWWLWFKSLLIAAIFSGILLRYLYLQQQLNNQQQAELRARLQSLQARIRPHFFFNSLNTIASLIPVDARAAESSLEDLSGLFRASLQTPGLVPLAEEIALCRRYLAIEQRRLGERLTMTWQLPEPLPSVQVPSLLLQPLLENAIYHGVQRLPQGGEVKLLAELGEKRLQIQIKNPLAADQGTLDTGNHMALENIRHRLQLYFDQAADLQIDRNPEQHYFKVTITLPYQS